MGRGICPQATKKARATESSTEWFTGYREEGWQLPWGVRQWGLWGFGTCRSGPQQNEAKNERVTWSVWATTSGCLQLPKPYSHEPASLLLEAVLPMAAGEIFFWPSFWRFLLPTPVSVVTSWPLKTSEWDSPTLAYPKRTILSARLMLGMKAFDYLAFLLISYNALGSFYKAIWLADINAETMRNPPSRGPAMRSHPFQSLCASQGSAADIAHSDSSLFRHPRSLAVQQIKGFFWKHRGKENICSVTVPLQMCSYAPWLEV